MAFELYMHDGFLGTSFNNDYLMAPNEAATAGEALSYIAGSLTMCSSTIIPQGISNSTIAAATPTPTTFVQLIKLNEEQVWKTVSTATVATTLIGSKVTLSSTGLGCTATTVNGTFMILSTDGATTNSTVTGRFKLS